MLSTRRSSEDGRTINFQKKKKGILSDTFKRWIKYNRLMKHVTGWRLYLAAFCLNKFWLVYDLLKLHFLLPWLRSNKNTMDNLWVVLGNCRQVGRELFAPLTVKNFKVTTWNKNSQHGYLQQLSGSNLTALILSVLHREQYKEISQWNKGEHFSCRDPWSSICTLFTSYCRNWNLKLVIKSGKLRNTLVKSYKTTVITSTLSARRK
jgi:hypothetical protein